MLRLWLKYGSVSVQLHKYWTNDKIHQSTFFELLIHYFFSLVTYAYLRIIFVIFWNLDYEGKKGAVVAEYEQYSQSIGRHELGGLCLHVDDRFALSQLWWVVVTNIVFLSKFSLTAYNTKEEGGGECRIEKWSRKIIRCLCISIATKF